MAKKMDFKQKLSIDQCVKLIDTVGTTITIVIRSEPGCGKSTILKMMEEKHKDKYDYVYVDCPVKDLSDICMNIPVRETKQLECFVSELFKMTSSKPKMIMLDECLKAPKMLQIIFTRLMLERSVGDQQLPEGSIIFATSNNSSDGVGDTMMAHAGNRVMMVDMKKPDHRQWGVWATDNGISALTRAWVAMNPQCLNSYTELTDDELSTNPYIFNPKKLTLSFVSPRSLAKNDVIVRSRDKLGDDITRAAMAGTVGAAAAEAMTAFFLIEKDLIPIKRILDDPETIKMPKALGALIMILFNAIDEIDTQDELSGFMKFVKRLESSELQGLFFTMACQSKKTVKLAAHNKELSKWLVENFNMFA